MSDESSDILASSGIYSNDHTNKILNITPSELSYECKIIINSSFDIFFDYLYLFKIPLIVINLLMRI